MGEPFLRTMSIPEASRGLCANSQYIYPTGVCSSATIVDRTTDHERLSNAQDQPGRLRPCRRWAEVPGPLLRDAARDVPRHGRARRSGGAGLRRGHRTLGGVRGQSGRIDETYERCLKLGARIHFPPQEDRDEPGYWALFFCDPTTSASSRPLDARDARLTTSGGAGGGTKGPRPCALSVF